MHWPYNGFWTARYRISQRSSLDSVADISLPHIIWSDQTFRQSSSSSSSSSDYPRLERGVSLLFTWSFINKAHEEEHFSYYISHWKWAPCDRSSLDRYFDILLWEQIISLFVGNSFLFWKTLKNFWLPLKTTLQEVAHPQKSPFTKNFLAKRGAPPKPYF